MRRRLLASKMRVPPQWLETLGVNSHLSSIACQCVAQTGDAIPPSKIFGLLAHELSEMLQSAGDVDLLRTYVGA